MVAIGADHAGYELKEKIKAYFDEKNIAYKDFGTNNAESCDYPMFSKAVAESVACGESEKGILVCGSGIGVCIAANKVRGIRAALCYEPELAVMARAHNNANIICIGSRFVSYNTAQNIVNSFLNTNFEGGRHQRRVKQIENLESDNAR